MHQLTFENEFPSCDTIVTAAKKPYVLRTIWIPPPLRSPCGRRRIERRAEDTRRPLACVRKRPLVAVDPSKLSYYALVYPSVFYLCASRKLHVPPSRPAASSCCPVYCFCSPELLLSVGDQASLSPEPSPASLCALFLAFSTSLASAATAGLGPSLPNCKASRRLGLRRIDSLPSTRRVR